MKTKEWKKIICVATASRAVKTVKRTSRATFELSAENRTRSDSPAPENIHFPITIL